MAEVETYYYLNHFQRMLTEVIRLYEDLFNDEENQFVTSFLALDRDAQCLYVRLVLRKGPFFRLDRIRYSEIDHLQSAYEKLVNCGLIEAGPVLTAFEIIKLFKKDELEELAHTLGITDLPGKSQRKEFWLTVLEREEELRRTICSNSQAFRRCKDDILKTFQMLYFGNYRQDLTSFITSQLGVICFETYVLDRDTRLFDDRSDIDLAELVGGMRDQLEWARSHRLEEEIEAVTTRLLGCKLSKTLPGFVVRSIDRMRYQLALHFQKRKNWELAIQLLSGCILPPARERLARIHLRLGDDVTAKRIVQEMQQNTRGPDEWYFCNRGPTIPRPLKMRFDFESFELDLAYIGSVEQAVIQYFGDQRCFFTENVLWKSVLGLAIWDLMYLPVKGAFVNPFQSGPIDLFDSTFYSSRRQLIDARLEEFLEKPNRLKSQILSCAQDKKGLSNNLVNWDFVFQVPLERIVDCLTVQSWVGVFRQMISNLRGYRTGFPDLLLLDPSENPGLEISAPFVFLEVKGPGDTLRPNQLAWIQKFHTLEIPFQMVSVRKLPMQ